jgi:solute:Na+ symporter, SSS family
MILPVKQVNSLDVLVVVAYLLMLTGVGIYLSRFNKTVDDFFKGGGKIPWWISGLSTFVAGFSAFMFVAAAGYTYTHGVGAIILFTSAMWGYGLGYAIYAVRWRRSRLSSPMEFLTRRFSQGTTYYYTFLSIVPAIMGLGLMIYTLCKFIAAALGIVGVTVSLGFVTLTGLEMSMIITGLVMLIYTSAGGLWAVVITDSLQFFIILVVSFLVFPLAYIALGNSWNLMIGFDRLVAEAPAGYLGLGDMLTRPMFYLAYMVATLIGYNAAWHIGQRYYSVPSEQDARKMAWLCAGLSLVLPFLWMAPTMASRVLFPDLAAIWPGDPHPEEAAFVTLALSLLPNGLIGLTLSAILAAAMTSIDTQLNFLASILIRDVYVRLRTGATDTPPAQKEQLTASRITAIVLGILATITAIFFQRWKSVFDVALNYYSWFSPSMLTPVMLGFLFRRTPSWSAIASATAGLLVVFVLNVFMSFGDVQYEINIFAGVGTSALVFFLTAFWPERLPAAVERIRLFFVDQDTPAEVEGLRWSGNALASYQIVGVLTAGIGCVVILLGLVPSSLAVHVITIALGAGTAFLGWLMTSYFRRQTKLISKK